MTDQVVSPKCLHSSSSSILVGTSGYSYTEWIEAGFYPSGSIPAQMLSLYAERFPITELNNTWYQMPKAEAIERLRRQAPPGFVFTAKLTRSLTHEVEPDWPSQAAAFRWGIAPLVHAGQLAAVLAQFPPSFSRSPERRRFLALLLDELAGLPLAVEFRHASWVNDKVFAELAKRGVVLASVDEPNLPGLFPPLDVVTNPNLFYIRFHGRNAKGWRQGGHQAQFDYDYSETELAEWLPRIAAMADKAARGVIFFNNHVMGQAPRNAETLIHRLKGQVLAVQGN